MNATHNVSNRTAELFSDVRNRRLRDLERVLQHGSYDGVLIRAELRQKLCGLHGVIIQCDLRQKIHRPITVQRGCIRQSLHEAVFVHTGHQITNDFDRFSPGSSHRTFHGDGKYTTLARLSAPRRDNLRKDPLTLEGNSIIFGAHPKTGGSRPQAYGKPSRGIQQRSSGPGLVNRAVFLAGLPGVRPVFFSPKASRSQVLRPGTTFPLPPPWPSHVQRKKIKSKF